MSKLKRQKGAREMPSAAPQIKISSFFQKNTSPVNKVLPPGGGSTSTTHLNNAVRKTDDSAYLPRSSEVPLVDESSQFTSPINPLPRKMQNNLIDSDTDDCIIPDTPESYIPNISRITDNSFGKSFTRKNIMSSEISLKVVESKTSNLNTSVTCKSKSPLNNVPVNGSKEFNPSSLKRYSDSTASCSKRSDKKTTPRKSVDSSGGGLTRNLSGDKYGQIDFKERLQSVNGDVFRRPHLKRDEFINVPPSKQPLCKMVGLAQNKKNLTNLQNATLDLNADAELQNALKDLSEFNNLDISECRRRKKFVSEDSSDVSIEKLVVADSQLIFDFSPDYNNRVSLNVSSNKLNLGNVRSRLTDRMQDDRRPLKPMGNLDAINECIRPAISELDSDVVLLRTLQELHEHKPVDISRKYNVTNDKQSNGRGISVLTNPDSQFINESINFNVDNSCDVNNSRGSNGVFKRDTEIFNSDHEKASVGVANAVEIISVSNSFEPPTCVADYAVEVNERHSVFTTSDIELDLQPPSLTVQTDASLQNSYNLDESDFNETISLPNDTVDKQTSDERASRYKPAFHEFGRHIIVNISKYPREIVLDLKAVSDGRPCGASLTGFWQDTYVAVDDIVNVIGSFDLDSVCRVTDNDNFIVVNPDMLISGTTIVSTMRCMRRTVLNQKFKGSDPANDAMLYGNILHAIFQDVLVARAASKDRVTAIVESVLTRPEFLHEMYSRDMSEKSVRSEILKYCPEIDAFVNNHLRRSDFKPPTTTTTNSNNFKNNSNKSSLPMYVVNVKDVEENIWSPRYGVKGKIDLTVEVKLQDERRQWMNSVIPLELKTGKATFSSEHKGQVMLYTMMSEDRRPRSSTSGLLLYLKDLSMQLVADSHAQKRGLIQLRNEFAHYVRKSQRLVPDEERSDNDFNANWSFGALPPPINDDFSCNKCPQLLNCSLYQNRLECYAPKPPHVMLQLVPESLAHLSAEHLDFFRLWCEMLHLEMLSSNAEDGISGLWMNTGQELESLGKCISQLEIVMSECLALGDGKYRQVFRPASGHFRERRLCDVGLVTGSSLIVSAENKPYIALTTGLVTSVTGMTVTLVTDRDLRLYLDCADTVYRLDNCDTYNSMSTSLNNLSRLMENRAACEKLRAIVIDRRAPEFQLTLSKVTINKVKDVFKLLNKPQKAAVLKIMMSKDYVLMKGYPGTGKTSTIVALVRIMTLLGQSVLLTSYTHSAVDNILLKLKQAGVDFLRIGRLERVHPELHEYTAERLQRTVTTVDQLDELYRSKSVVATTCLAMNHAIFTRRRFDVCVVDEATQVLLPACLSALFAADRFVLVGDPKQLPPIVHNKRAKHLGMDRSLFIHLEDAGSTYSLTLQYRMNGEIMRLSNMLTYDGALNCANSEVADARLSINSSGGVMCTSDWLRRCVSNQKGDEVLWLNTDTINVQPTEQQNQDPVGFSTEFRSRRPSPDLQSTIEAEIVRTIVRQLMLGGVGADDIGVITPYRQQVLLLRQTINTEEIQQEVASSSNEHVEINTVDQYQGRDKPVIIVSFVKSRDSHASEILKDVRRLNVAITRAKHKLIFVGSVDTLSSYDYLRDLITKVLTASQIVTLA